MEVIPEVEFYPTKKTLGTVVFWWYGGMITRTICSTIPPIYMTSRMWYMWYGQNGGMHAPDERNKQYIN
jgi:TRAP-type mannitol/chloroaromatic compound transport system substrate-binding protein